MGVEQGLLALIGAADVGGYEIEQSLRFDDNGSTYLNRTPSSAGNQKTWTFSAWLKRGSFTANQGIFNPVYGGDGSNESQIRWKSDNTLQIYDSGGARLNFVTTQVFRDPSAWYHLVIAVDTTQATEANRFKLYINGEQITAFGTSTYPTQNQTLGWNGTSRHDIGRYAQGGNLYYGGYMAEIHHVDGTQLDPTSFGEYDDNDVWRPINVSGLTYGTNGFYINFSNSSNLGEDQAGSNDFTANGFTVNPDPYVLATKTSGTFSTGTLRDVFDASSGAAGGVYQEATTGSTAASTIDIEFSSPLSGTITVEASDGTGGTNNGGQYQLIDSTDTVQVTQARPTNTTTFTHTGLSDITKLRMYGGSSGAGGILISRFESSDQTIRTADWLGEGDVMSDTPTTNWATLNPLDKTDGGFGLKPDALSDGNLVDSSAYNSLSKGTIGVTSGKWYFEFTGWNSTSHKVGVALVPPTSSPLSNIDLKLLNYNGQYQSNAPTGTAGGTTYGGSISSTDIIGVAIDMDNRTIAWAVNNQWANGSGSWNQTYAASTKINLESTGGVTPCCLNGSVTGTARTFNFGQRAFAYTPPTGFKALNTSNLPAPTIKDGSDYFNAVAYAGNSSTQSINVGFQPDFLWLKSRTQGYSHWLVDSIRGTYAKLSSDSTAAENTDTTKNPIEQFTSTGFDLQFTADDGLTYSDVNASGQNFIAWNWLAGNGTSSNTAGSVTSTVSVNPTAGFSIVNFTGTGSALTVGHGLGVAPDLMIAKNRDTADNWVVWHNTFNMDNYIFLNSDQAKATTANPATFWNNTAPTSTVVSVGANSNTNVSGNDTILYCFAEVEGYSKFGSYTGNGATSANSGPFVYLGFKPSMVIIKRTDGAGGGWGIWDNKRNTYNIVDNYLFPNTSGIEADGNGSGWWNLDFLSNGFRVQSFNESNTNASGGNYIYMAFAENPFGGSGVSPATAR